MRSMQSRRALAAIVMAITCASGCGSDVAVAPQPTQNPPDLYWTLELAQRGVTLSTFAPYDTLVLSLVARAVTGAPIDTAGAVVGFTTSDPSRVIVSPQGVLYARDAGAAFVAVTLTIGNITHVDTALVSVTTVPAPPVLASFSIHPEPPEVAAGPAAGDFDFFYVAPPMLPLRARDAAGNDIPDVAVSARSLDPEIATIDPAYLTVNGRRPGQARFVATVTVYGVTMTDTLDYIVGPPVTAVMGAVENPFANRSTQPWAFFTPAVTIEEGGYVVWFWVPGPPRYEIVFDDPTEVKEDSVFCLCGQGNIEIFGDSVDFLQAIRVRHFPKPGTYTFRSPTLGGASARVVVMPRPSIAAFARAGR